MDARRTGKGQTPGGATRRQAARPSLPFGLDDTMDDMLEDDEDDELEAELNALINGGQQPSHRTRPPPRPSKQHPPAPVAPPRSQKKAPADTSSRQANSQMPSRIMDFDLSSIERMGEDDDEDDEDIDEDDPELLAELEELSPDVPEVHRQTAFSPPPRNTTLNPSGPAKSSILVLLEERLENYEGGHQDAVYDKDTSKVRRYERAIRIIKDQIGQCKKGQPVDEDDIPPPVFVKSVLQKTLSDSVSTPSEPSHVLSVSQQTTLATSQKASSSTGEAVGKKADREETPMTVADSALSDKEPSKDGSAISALRQRRELYRQAALKAKAEDNKLHSIRCMKIYKEFEIVIKAAEEGQEIDLSEMPPPPDQLPEDFHDAPDSQPVSTVRTNALVPPAAAASGVRKSPVSADDSEIPDIDPSEVKATFKAPDNPKTILEALQQRLDKYKSTYDEAKSTGDSSKARRMDRIVKQYQEAIKDYQAKRAVNFEELPCPPGFGPIPVGRPPPSTAAAATAASPVTGSHPGASAQHATVASSHVKRHSATAAGGPAIPLVSGRESRHQQQYHLLVEREKQFKLAALKAKKEGAIETAKMYLRQANGLKPMIEASASGLPVDVTSVPKAPPGMGNDSEDYEVVQYEDAGADGPASRQKGRTDIYSQLEKDLVEQIGMCVRNVTHFKKCGDIAMSERFEKFNQQSRKDLDSLRNAFKHGAQVPRFHYETRAFSVVKHFPELAETVMELSIIRGFGYTLTGFSPADFTTYVKWDFAYPTDSAQSARTSAIKGTNEPEYNATFPIQINRKNRQCLRILKKGIRCEVYVRMGFLKADKILGIVVVCLDTLETKCVHHTSIDLMEGKKAVGGKLEVRLRLREPLVRPQVETLQEKWLVIDQFVR